MSIEEKEKQSPACFVTGHRPNRFHFPESDPRCQKIKDAIESEIKRLYDEQGIRGVWVDGGAGVGTWAGEIVIRLREQEKYRDLKLYMAIPFPGHDENAPPKQRERYRRIRKECADSVVVCRAFRQDAYKKRDYYMADHSVCGIAVYDQDRSVRSGLGMVVNYATKQRELPVTFIHPDTLEINR